MYQTEYDGGDDSLIGELGNDALTGDAGDDHLFGSEGLDILTSGRGNDFVNGGNGTDDVANFTGNISEYTVQQLANGSYQVEDSISDCDGIDILINIESITFADVNESIDSTTTPNPQEPISPTITAPTLTIKSGGSSTRPTSSGGNTPPISSAASERPTAPNAEVSPPTNQSSSTPSSILGLDLQNDIRAVQLETPFTIGSLQFNQAVIGTQQPDVINGSDRGEAITGGPARDRLTGNGGGDAFILDSEQPFGKAELDLITDFSKQEGATIVLGLAAFGRISKVRFKATFGKQETKASSASRKTIIYNQKSGMLYCNANGMRPNWGAGGGEFAKLLGAPEISKADFVIA